MSNFSNLYYATIDDKGRVVLPSVYKHTLGEDIERTVAVEIDPFEKCLNIYPNSSWEKRIAFVRSKLNPNDPRQSKFLDKFYQQFVMVNVSENGRMNIPNLMLERGAINKDVVFTGQGDKIRLWDVEEYRKSMLPDEEYSSLFQELLGGSL